MIPKPASNLRVAALGLYTFSLRLYPRAFRQRYRDDLVHAAWAELQRSPDGLRTCLALLWDTVTAAVSEHWRAATPAGPGYVALFALFFSALLLVLSVVNQQLLRRGADREPQVLASLVQFASPQSPSVAATLKHPRQELSSEAWLGSNSTFIALFDAAGKVTASNATLNGALPQPPHGIFRTIRERGEFKVSWQPRPGLRVALTGLKLPSGGFVLAGQSLLPSEARNARFRSLLLLLWMVMMAACATIVLAARTRRQSRV